MSRDLPFIDEQPRRAPWLLPLLLGMVIGGCVVGLVRADSQLEHHAQDVAAPEISAEPTEAVLWTVDVDGESAP